MKLINRPYYTDFDCFISGKIKLSEKELDQAVKHLLRSRKWCEGSYNEKMYKDLLRQDLKRTVLSQKGTRLLNIRVNATRELAKYFGLANHQLRNYVLEVI